MGFKGQKEFIETAFDSGFSYTYSFRKIAGQTSSAGVWFDMSMAAGNPSANFYASEPMVSAELGSRYSMYVGPSISPMTKHLHKWCVYGMTTGLPCTFKLVDTLLYYPFIDGDNTDEQFFENTVSLPRYTDGLGVKIMIVALGVYTGGGTINISYTNQSGVSGRLATSTMNTGLGAANLATTGGFTNSTGPFIPLQAGDNGVRSVESITFPTAKGGSFAVVLVKPIASTFLKESAAPNEKDFIVSFPSMPKIEDNAKLTMIAMPNGSIAGSGLNGLLEVVVG